MRAESTLVTRIRELMEPSNPVPSTRYQGEAPYQAEIAAALTQWRSEPLDLSEPELVDPAPERPTRRPTRRRGRDSAWRVLAPVLSGLAVVAVVTGLTIAAGPAPGRSKGGPGPTTSSAVALPRYFATVGGRVTQLALTIHLTSTGKPVATLPFSASESPIRAVAAGSSGRVFYVAVQQRPSNSQFDIGVYRARLSADGHWRIGLLPVKVPDDGDTLLNEIGVSPDGSQLAITAQLFNKARQHTELLVAPLNGQGATATRVWSAPAVPAIALDPVWTDNHDVAFLWQDHLTGSDKFGGRSQERVLDTSHGGSNLLSAKVLVGTDAGLMETAYASPHGGPVFASIANDVPAKGNNGVATIRLIWFTPHQPGFTILALRRIHYHNLPGRDNADAFFKVFGLDSSGQHALVASPGLGKMTIIKLTPLPGKHGLVTGAAW